MGQVSTGALPSPLRLFLAQLDELCSGGIPDMGRVGQALVELAADEEYFVPLIGQSPPSRPGCTGWSGRNGVPAWCLSTGPRE